jgi:hypothetical protein
MNTQNISEMLHIEINEKPFQFSVPVALPNRNHMKMDTENMYEVSSGNKMGGGGGGVVNMKLLSF